MSEKKIHIFKTTTPIPDISPKNTSQYKFRIHCLASGSGKFELNKRLYSIKPKTILFFDPFQRPAFSYLKNVRGYSVLFDEDFFYQHTEHKDLLFRNPFIGYALNQPDYKPSSVEFKALHHVMENMYFDSANNHPRIEKLLTSYINIFLLKCVGLKPISSHNLKSVLYTSFELVTQYKRLIRIHFREQHGVSFYANLLNQTSNSLNNEVKMVTGKTAGELIYEQIVVEAKRLLIHTRLSPKEVGFELGFKDHSYFTKFFFRYTGFKPLEWFHKNK